MRPWIRSFSNILPKCPGGTTFRLKIQFHPPKRPLRDAFLAQNTILSAQKAPAGLCSGWKYNFIRQENPAGRFFGSKYNLIRPKDPCGMLFRLKIQFYPPKRPLRDAFLAQNTIWSVQKAPAGRFPDLRNIKKYVSWYFFCFDICNLKLFTITNRLGIVPSLQNIKNIQLLMILMSQKCHFRKNVEK